MEEEDGRRKEAMQSTMYSGLRSNVQRLSVTKTITTRKIDAKVHKKSFISANLLGFMEFANEMGKVL
ncbi:Mannose-binding lectin [Sesbania bispinosa]|nr:Mannose-binding lectin [Sesbania bispinosa]